MIIDRNDLNKVKYPENFKYKAYHIRPRLSCYTGEGIVAVIDIDSANNFIKEFEKLDKNNKRDSWGWSYVDESTYYGLSDEEGILEEGIYYTG